MNTNQKSMRYDQNDYDALLHSKIPAALVETPQMNFDDASDASVFFARELDYVKSQSYDVEYPEFTALKLFPVSSEINPGAETVTYYSYDKTGMAKIISNYATDLPRADVKGKPTTAIIKSLGDSYGYSIQEMRASAMAGKSLDARKAESARYQIDYLNNKIAWNGDAETGLRGVLSKDNDVPLYVPATGAKGSTKWADKTEDEILADITGMLKQVARTTKKVEKPDTLVLPSEAYIEIQNRRIESTATTVLKYIQDNITDIARPSASVRCCRRGSAPFSLRRGAQSPCLGGRQSGEAHGEAPERRPYGYGLWEESAPPRSARWHGPEHDCPFCSRSPPNECFPQCHAAPYRRSECALHTPSCPDGFLKLLWLSTPSWCR